MTISIKQTLLKIRVLLIGLLLVTGCKNIETGASADKSSESLAPRIVFTETLYDFGRRMSGNDLEHTFTFTNEGDAVLVIEDIKRG